MIASLQATKVFEKIWEEYQSKKHRFCVLEGGTGSSKSYSLAQLFALIMIKEKGVQLTIARKTFPALRMTLMKDFFNVIKDLGIYKEEWHNKTESVFKYPLTNSEVDFLSIDEPTRVRSRRRHFLIMNEANEFNEEDFEQLNMRTDKQIFMDYNPSHQYHWIYDKIQTRKDCIVIPSTYKDNPFLSKELVKEIENYQNTDQNYWRIYGLGLKGTSELTIYTNWDFCDELPEGDKTYGLDFGWNNPSCLLEIVLRDEGWYVKEKIYEKYLTNSQLIQKFGELGIPKNKEIYCDSAEPQRIAEIQNAGYQAISADKDVKKGIDTIKTRKIFITKDSPNILKEIKRYSWKSKDADEPVKIFEHSMDALRYGVHSHHKEFGIRKIGGQVKELTMDEMRKQEIAEAIKRANTGEIGQEYRDVYENL